ncbi:MAG: hypothetical protein NTY45_05415 [Elusimicrobia bacterium]|nr:hypothetical protein [Elusimicrobiota bacterium]
MLKKWDVVPAPNEKNPGRHKLLIKGEMKDIFLIVKKLGSVCSRPEKTSGAFDFIIYLSKLEMDILAKLKAVTSELGAVSGGAESDAGLNAVAEPQWTEPKIESAPAPWTEPCPKPSQGPRSPA